MIALLLGSSGVNVGGGPPRIGHQARPRPPHVSAGPMLHGLIATNSTKKKLIERKLQHSVSTFDVVQTFTHFCGTFRWKPGFLIAPFLGLNGVDAGGGPAPVGCQTRPRPPHVSAGPMIH